MTPESRTLHHILSAVIIDGIQRSRTDADLAARAESAARALRAGLSAFTAPAEPLTSGSVNASIPVTVHYGGTAGGCVGQSVGTASGPQIQTSPASKLSLIEQRMVATVEATAKSMARLATLCQLADAAAQVPIERAGDQKGLS